MEELLETGSFSLASGQFLLLFAVFLTGYVFLYRNVKWRNSYILLFSLFFYWKLSGTYVLLLAGVSLTDWLIAFAVDKRITAGEEVSGSRRRTDTSAKWFVALSVIIDAGVLVVFKLGGFFAGLANVLAGREIINVATLIIPAGVSFFVFQSISYVVDVYRGAIRPLKSYWDYLLLLSFFPKMTLGPLVRNDDFIGQLQRPVTGISNDDFGKAARLIASGIIKYCIISRCVGALIVGPAFSSPAEVSGTYALVGLYAFAIQIYCDFSGYTDLAIGIALLIGFRLPVNFDAPYKSATVTEFWRRWHISLSSWLRNYIYIPLGGNRKGIYRTYFNLIVTMLIGGIWHGAGWTFVIWGMIHGLALAVHKFWLSVVPGSHKSGEGMNAFQRIGGVFLTFHLVLFGWLFFNSPSLANVLMTLSSIFTDFHFSGLDGVLSAAPAAYMLMLLGYVLHFLPAKWTEFADKVCSRGGFVVCLAVVVAAIWLALQSTALLPVDSSAGLPIYANF